MKKISLEKLADLEKARSDSAGGEKLPSQIVSEMKRDGIPHHLCDFILQSFHSLQRAKGHGKPLSGRDMSAYMKTLKDLEDPKDLTALLLSMEHALKSLKGYTMRFNQVAALLLLMFDSEERAKGRLLEVATGEGKSCVIACFAAAQVCNSIVIWNLGRKLGSSLGTTSVHTFSTFVGERLRDIPKMSIESHLSRTLGCATWRRTFGARTARTLSPPASTTSATTSSARTRRLVNQLVNHWLTGQPD